ncbi:hypothetical protein GCM10009547_43210 [Sporichthya brevicatena]|uniref:Linalool dehydratase/isomerase domain-containing protein n=1 Tax=Sporichthya brevicatena TaxID=171442 RepID=A0ABP3SF49_9ACTN
MTAVTRESSDRLLVVLIPRPSSVWPPVAGRRLQRALLLYLTVWLLAVLPGLVGAGTGWQAAGLGLALPGGGFLFSGQVLAAVATLLALVVATFLWWSIGIVLLPPLVWIGSAVLAGILADTGHTAGRVLALALMPAAFAAFALLHRFRHAAQVRRGAALNAELARTRFVVTGTPPIEGRVPVAEHSETDLAQLRHLLDLGLQPLDRFQGFDDLDEFREAATRYQTTAVGYALAMSQFTRTPAFTGYLQEAQRNLVLKMLRPEVWSYWRLENAWGNLRLDADPVDTPDNIMLTGYWGTQIGMYEAMNDTTFSAPGSLSFQGRDRRYAYSFGDLARMVDRNFGLSDFTLFPCEPNWIYTGCNTFGINTILAHDTVHGTRYFADREEQIRTAVETEFCRPDGKVIGIRNKLLGLSWNIFAGPMAQTTAVYWLHAPYPDLAQRSWWLLRRHDLPLGADGRARLAPLVSSRVDPGNYRLGSDAFAWSALAMAARELGDEEYAVAAEAALAEREAVTANGARRYEGASVWANSYAALARFGRRSALRDMLAFGPPSIWRTGPALAEVAYPDVLVARAVTDGRALDLVLRPGSGPVRTVVAVERLVPHRRYTVTGAGVDSVTADGAGRALLEVDVPERREIRLY